MICVCKLSKHHQVSLLPDTVCEFMHFLSVLRILMSGSGNSRCQMRHLVVSDDNTRRDLSAVPPPSGSLPQQNYLLCSVSRHAPVWGLLLFCDLATSKVIPRQVPTCISVHSWRFYSTVVRENQAASTITCSVILS